MLPSRWSRRVYIGTYLIGTVGPGCSLAPRLTREKNTRIMPLLLLQADLRYTGVVVTNPANGQAEETVDSGQTIVLSSLFAHLRGSAQEKAR